MKSLFTIAIIFFCLNVSFSQKDTTINERIYTIIEIHSNGNLKYIGQFNTTCIEEIIRKHGYFIQFDFEGNEIKKQLYFFDEERNRKVLA